MIHVNVRERDAAAQATEPITSGSVGLAVSFHFSEDWDELTKAAVFKGSGTAVDVALTSAGSCAVPHEVLQSAGGHLKIGVYGTGSQGQRVTPTVWADAGQIFEGAAPSQVTPTPATQSLIDQLLEAAQASKDAAEAAQALAQSVRDDADTGAFDGAPGQDGAPGAEGVGVPAGGSTGQVLKKRSGSDYDTGWADDTNTDVMAYDIRRNKSTLKCRTALYRYMLCFTYDEETVLPANAVNNDTGTGKTLTTEAFDPFGPIYYYNLTSAISANASVGPGNMWMQKTDASILYSFNTGSALTAQKDIFLVVSPQTDGKVKLHSSPISQALPSSADNLLYIKLGRAYDTSHFALDLEHPIYYYAGGKIRQWTNAESGGVVTDVGVTGSGENESLYISTDDEDFSVPTSAALTAKLAKKLDVDQGLVNAGKFLVVGSDGAVTPTAMSAWQGGNY